MLFWLCCIAVVPAIVFGGATHAGYLGDVAVQLLSIPLLIVALWPALSTHDPHRHKARLTFALLCTVALLTLIQVLPLPFDVWHGGSSLLSWPAALEVEPRLAPWPMLSLTPQATWAAAASLIVPLAVFGAVSQLGLRHRSILSWLLLALGGISLILGFAQVAQGPESTLRFYDITNPGEAVGFFANRNHFAAQLYVTLVLAAAWLQILAERAFQRKETGTHSILLFVGSAAFLVAVVAGLALARSRAGIFLTIAALGGIAFMAFKGAPAASERRSPLRSGRHATLIVLAFAAIFAAQFGLGGILTRFQTAQGPDLRGSFNTTTFETVLKALPFGTGLGSFVPVYAAVEKAKDIFNGYANRAHDDLAELLLETGIAGGGLLLVFLAWFLWRTYLVWFRPQTAAPPVQIMLERAATLIIALMLAHSLGDYPLRTTALSTAFAFMCAILASPVAALPIEERSHRSADLDVPHYLPPESDVSEGTWGSDVHWPEDWQKREA